MAPPRPLATPAMPHPIPWLTLLLGAATLVLSVSTAIEISGSWLGRVRIVQLEDYGIRFSHLRDLELWRLVTSQLVHVKQPHMVGDVVCLLWVGAVVERRIGALRLLVLWLVGGSAATLFSTLFVAWPWNLGTGSSQAIMAIAGAGLWRRLSGADRSWALAVPVVFAIALAFTIDIVHVLHPKPGHVAGVLIGLLFGWWFSITPRAEMPG